MAERVCDMLPVHVVLPGLFRMEHIVECDSVSVRRSQHLLSCRSLDIQGSKQTKINELDKKQTV